MKSLKATRKEWIGLAVLALPCILATMDLTVLNLAVPHLSEDLKPTGSQLLWIMDIYGFFIAGSLITMGTLGDRIGRRKVLLFGAAAFGVASALAAFSRSAELLIVTRALLGIAGATLAPSTLSLIRNMFLDDHERTVAIGIWVMCFSLGAAIGPLAGGLLLQYFHWSSVFLLNIPVMVLLLVLGPILLPEFRDPSAGRLDIASAVLSLAAVLALIYSLKISSEFGLGKISVTTFVIGVSLGGLFVYRQKILPDPLIDIRLFRSPSFTASLLLNMFACFVAFGTFLFTGQYMQLVLNYSPLKAGLWSIPASLAFTIGGLLTPQLVRVLKPKYVIAGGLFLSSYGFYIFTFVEITHAFIPLMWGLVIYSLGISPIFTLSTDLVVSAVAPERAGSAASLSETSTEFGGALGMAILGSVGAAVYRSEVGALIPASVPASMGQAARNTLGAAIAVSKQLPDEVGTRVMLSAKQAFIDALHTICRINLGIVIVLAIVALIFIRRKEQS